MRIVCDSSSLISLSETAMLDALPYLSQKAGVEFVIPPSVEKESITHPRLVHRYALSALRLERQIEEKNIAVRDAPGLAAETQRILAAANHLLTVEGRPLEILQLGESECLALLALEKDSVFLVDEKTARLVVENPARLRESLRGEYAREVQIDARAAEELAAKFAGASVIRSAELLALAAEQGFFSSFGGEAREVFHASVYAVRAAGCSLTENELDEYEKIPLHHT